MDLVKQIEKHMPLVLKVRESVFPDIAPDHVRAMKTPEDDYDGIEFGGYNFYPVEESIATLTGKRPVLRWNMTAWKTSGGSYMDPPDVDEVEIGQFNSVVDCLAEVGRQRYLQQIDAVGEAMFYEEMEQVGEMSLEVLMMEREQDSRCPHGLDYAECNACMVASDFAHDAAREDRHFGRG